MCEWGWIIKDKHIIKMILDIDECYEENKIG